MIKPSSRLIAAIFLAVGFVLFRIGYAIVFTGASGGERLLDLSGIRLGGILSHVTLFGSIGADGLLRVISNSLPFAFAILAFGVVSMFLGPEKLARFATRSRSNFLRALGIGFAVLPSLAEAATRIGQALSYRSAPKRFALVPLLETAIARANAISEALLSRAKAPKLSDAIFLPAALAGSEVTLKAGDALVVSGPTGSGKTTLLRSVAARPLDPSRQQQLEIFGYDAVSDPQVAAKFSEYVSQSPRDAFIDWRQPDGKQTGWLSEGQAVWQAVSEALAREPELLILDEPYASLDDSVCRALNQLLARYRESGGIVVLAEHDQSRVVLPGAIKLELGEVQQFEYTKRLPQVVGRDPIFSFEKNVFHQAELTALVGPNGVGKTSYLKRFLAAASKQGLATRFVPERVEDMFISQSLSDEFALSDRLSKSKPGTTEANFAALLSISPAILETHPRDLSAGTKLVLAVAIALALRPQLLLIDEPVKGLDPVARAQMAEVLACVQETGCAIVFATHDQGFAQTAGSRIELAKVVKA